MKRILYLVKRIGKRIAMIFRKFGVALLSLFAFSQASKNPRVKGSSAMKFSPFAELDRYMTPRLVEGGNAPSPGRKGKFKTNQRKERKAAAKRRAIAAHRKARKVAEQRQRRTRYNRYRRQL